MAKAVPEIKAINLGGMKVRENTRNISKAINITQEEEGYGERVSRCRREVEIRQCQMTKKWQL